MTSALGAQLRAARTVSAPTSRPARPRCSRQVAPQAGSWRLEAGSGGAAGAGWPWASELPKGPPSPRGRCLLHSSPVRKGAPGGGGTGRRLERAPRVPPGPAAPGPQGTWACSGRDCARASPRTWSRSCGAAGSRQVTAGARQCGPHGWPRHTRGGPSPPSCAPGEPGNVGVGEPRPWEGRTPPTVCPAPRRVPRLRQSARARESQVRDVPGLPPCPPAPRVSFSVVDLVSADLEEVAQKCGLSYKVS